MEEKGGGIFYIKKLKLLKAKSLTGIYHNFHFSVTPLYSYLNRVHRPYPLPLSTSALKRIWEGRTLECLLSEKGRTAIQVHFKERNNAKINLFFDVFVNNLVLLCIIIMKLFLADNEFRLDLPKPELRHIFKSEVHTLTVKQFSTSRSRHISFI